MNSETVETVSTFDWAPVLTFVGGLVAGFLGLWSTRIKAKSEHEATVPASWRDLTTEMKAWWQEQNNHLEERLDKLEEIEQVRLDYDSYVTDAIARQRVWATEHKQELPEILTFREWQQQRFKLQDST